MRCVKQVLILAVLLLMPSLGRAGYLTPDLQTKLDQASPDERLKVIVRMAVEADISVFPPSQREAMVQHLKDFAAQSQGDLLASLPAYGDKVAKVRPFWIYNGIALEAIKDVILPLSQRPDVDYIEEDQVVKIEPFKKRDEPGINTIEWNIARIEAQQVWALGYDGKSIVVGNIDSGVMVNHITFGGRWRGGTNSWFDVVNGQPSPYDDNGHGTHTMGILCGGSTGDSIGVAPGATFVCVKAFDSGGSGQFSWIDASYQWFANLGYAAPQVVSNSWGTTVGSNTHFWRESRNLQILGIHQSYGVGGSGPGSGTVGCPASYPHLFGVGSTDNTDLIVNSSSRGPSPNFGVIETSANYLDPNWAASRRKPDLSAPGINIRSAFNNGGYTSLSGSYVNVPHLAGTIALMLHKNPDLTDQQIWQIITTACDTPSVGRPYPNQNYGWGRLNAYRAVSMTTEPYSQFRLKAVPGDTILPSTSKTDSIILTSLGGFSSPIVMTLDSIRPAEPSINIMFNPNPVTPPPNGIVKTGLQIMTSSTPEGNYALFYHAQGDTVIRYGRLNLWVTPPTFLLKSTPRYRRVVMGDSVEYADTTISILGFHSPCTLSATVSPPNPFFTISFLPDSIVIPTDGRMMRVRALLGPTGQYLVTITARSGSIVKTLDDTLMVVPPVAQGPDPYGYYAYDNTDSLYGNMPVYAWIELNPSRGGNGTSIGPGGDDVTFRLPLSGVRVRHYGQHFDSVSVCSNGWLAFGATTSTVSNNVALPSSLFLHNGVAVFWDDLDTRSPGTWWYRRDPNQRFIVEWDSVARLGTTSYNSFEIFVFDTTWAPPRALTRDSEIILQWRRAPDVSSMTVGQQNATMDVGLNCLFNGIYDPMMAPILSGRALKFTTEPPRSTGISLGSPPEIPLKYELGIATPNPSKSILRFSYSLPVESWVTLHIYNLTGQLVRPMVSGKVKAGYRYVSWDGRDGNGKRVPAGLYFYRLQAGPFTATRKMLLLR